MQDKSLRSPKFQPLELPQSPVVSSPNKNLTGSARIIRDLTADIYNNIQSWNGFHIQGAQVVKQIAVLKADSIDEYSTELEECTNCLYTVTGSLRICKEKFYTYKNQLLALQKIEKSNKPLFMSLSVNDMVKLLEVVTTAYSEEFKVKQLVLENIAHAKTKDEVMFYAACWTLQPHITSYVNLKVEVLLIEAGHRKPS